MKNSHTMKTVAFVPIRLNSQRVAGKNLRSLSGSPLMCHILKTLTAVEAIEGPDGADPTPGQVVLARRRHDGARGTAPGRAEGHGAPRGTPRRRQRPLRKTPSAAP